MTHACSLKTLNHTTFSVNFGRVSLARCNPQKSIKHSRNIWGTFKKASWRETNLKLSQKGNFPGRKNFFFTSPVEPKKQLSYEQGRGCGQSFYPAFLIQLLKALTIRLQKALKVIFSFCKNKLFYVIKWPSLVCSKDRVGQC